MNPAGMFLEWEGGLRVDLPGGTRGSGDTVGEAMRPQRMLTMID